MIELDESVRDRRLSEQVARSIGPLRLLIEKLDLADQHISSVELAAYRELCQASWSDLRGSSSR